MAESKRATRQGHQKKPSSTPLVKAFCPCVPGSRVHRTWGQAVAPAGVSPSVPPCCGPFPRASEACQVLSLGWGLMVMFGRSPFAAVFGTGLVAGAGSLGSNEFVTLFGGGMGM